MSAIISRRSIDLNYCLIAVLVVLSLFTSANVEGFSNNAAFIVRHEPEISISPQTPRIQSQLTRLHVSNPSKDNSKNGSRSTAEPYSRKRKTVRDRTQAETLSLLQDILQTAFEAGPRAAPARTIQAYVAFSRTIQDFIPTLNTLSYFNVMGRNSTRTNSSLWKQPEPFSTPVALRKLFERMGATYIKLGQFIASSPTLFPREYVIEFQKCLDKTEALPWDVVKKVIEKELGGPIRNYFAFVDENPLASASIAQVHAAKLKSGEDVVIKIQKPQIDESLKADLSFIYIASRVLEFLQPDFERTSLSAVVSDIRTSMLEELDFQKEATNVEEFREFLVRQNLRNVATAPKIYRSLTTKKVLTMERLRGVSMLDANAISRITRGDPESTIITALNVWSTSVLSMPWFHADVHAGNLLVLDDGRVGFIDFGIVGRVSEKTFQAVTELSAALALTDYYGMAQALANMGATDEEVNLDQFASDIQRVLNSLGTVQPDVTVTAGIDGTVTGRLDFDENELTQVLLDIVDVTDKNGLKLPREFGLLVKQSLYFDRYLKILAPDLNVASDSRVALSRSSTGPTRKTYAVIDAAPVP